jgi:hypothetical protein
VGAPLYASVPTHRCRYGRGAVDRLSDSSFLDLETTGGYVLEVTDVVGGGDIESREDHYASLYRSDLARSCGAVGRRMWW